MDRLLFRRGGEDDFISYDLVVLDPQLHPPLRVLREEKKTILAYLSLGEVENYRNYFQAALLRNSPLRPQELTERI